VQAQQVVDAVFQQCLLVGVIQRGEKWVVDAEGGNPSPDRDT